MENSNPIRNLVTVAKREIKHNSYTRPLWRKVRGQSVPSFLVVLEKPASHETVSQKITIRGWALSLVGKVVRGEIQVNDKVVGPVVFSVNRPDVVQKFDLLPDQQMVGFNQEIDWEDKCGRNVSEATLQVRFYHGRDVTVIGPITLTHTSSPYLVHQRGSYKEVWDSASTNHDDAMYSVAGFANYEEFMESGRVSAETFQQALGITENDIVLEIGCGTGRVGASLARMCRHWVGTDISKNMLSFAKKNLLGYPNVSLVELSGCNLKQIADSSIDKVYCTAVFMHLDQWDRYRYVMEAHRVLKPKGKLYIDNLNLGGETAWQVFADVAALDSAQRPPHVTKHSTADELSVYLSRAGFQDIKTMPGDHWVGALGTKKD